VIHLSDIRLSSPGMRITSGTGTYWPNGRIDFRGAGVSRAYGTLAVVVTGTAARPNVELRAANPGFGIGLRDVRASIRATAAATRSRRPASPPTGLSRPTSHCSPAGAR
jgi:translocation and assembly module TamB